MHLGKSINEHVNNPQNDTTHGAGMLYSIELLRVKPRIKLSNDSKSGDIIQVVTINEIVTCNIKS